MLPIRKPQPFGQLPNQLGSHAALASTLASGPPNGDVIGIKLNRSRNGLAGERPGQYNEKSRLADAFDEGP